MSCDGKPTGLAIHATAVAIDGWGLVILGPSKSGKSTLAAALISRSRPGLPIVLVGDDRILLEQVAGNLSARVHPRIAGFIERRGLGLVASPFVERASVDAIVCLGPATMPHPALANFPLLRVVDRIVDLATIDQVWSWALARHNATTGPQVAAKKDARATSASKH